MSGGRLLAVLITTLLESGIRLKELVTSIEILHIADRVLFSPSNFPETCLDNRFHL